MVKTIKQLTAETKLNNTGRENMIMTDLSDFDMSNPKIRLFSFIQLKPGEEVQYHMHIGETENYFILSGSGIYNDNGNKVEVVSGMATYTPSGQGHSLKNTGDEDLVFIALIVED